MNTSENFSSRRKEMEKTRKNKKSRQSLFLADNLGPTLINRLDIRGIIAASFGRDNIKTHKRLLARARVVLVELILFAHLE